MWKNLGCNLGHSNIYIIHLQGQSSTHATQGHFSQQNQPQILPGQTHLRPKVQQQPPHHDKVPQRTKIQEQAHPQLTPVHQELARPMGRTFQGQVSHQLQVILYCSFIQGHRILEKKWFKQILKVEKKMFFTNGILLP